MSRFYPVCVPRVADRLPVTHTTNEDHWNGQARQDSQRGSLPSGVMGAHSQGCPDAARQCRASAFLPAEPAPDIMQVITCIMGW
jgi:hypothetical protein